MSLLWKLVLKYLIESWWSPLYQKAVKKLLIWIRILPPEDGGKADVDYIEKILWESTKARRPRKKTLERIYGWKENNPVRLPVLVECLKRQRNLGKLSNSLEDLASDQRVDESVKLLQSPSLHQWIDAFCYFCTIFNSGKSFKKKNDSNLKHICGSSLFLLDSAIPEFSRIEPAHQEQLCKRILSTYIAILEKMKNNWPDLMQDHLHRMIERVPVLLKDRQADEELQNLLLEFSKQIPPAFEAALGSHLVNFAPIMSSACEQSDEETCDLLKISTYLGPDQGCWFLRKAIEHTIGSPKYMNIAKTNAIEAIKIASAINSLLSQCSKACLRNAKNLCNGAARIFLRDWMYNYAYKLRIDNPKVHEELSIAIMRIEKNINPSRNFRIPNRPLINSNGDIISNIDVLNGVVKHVSENGALFVYDRETLDKKIHFAGGNENKLAFTVSGKHISKPLKEISIYEPMKVSHSPQHTVQLFGVKFIDKLSMEEYDLCKKHAKNVLV